MFRTLLQVLLFALPWPLRRICLRAVFGYEIAPDARIGFSVVNARKLVMQTGSRIGSLTYIKGLTEVRLEEAAVLGNLNWVTGLPEGHATFFAADVNRRPALILGRHSAITHRHLIDCTDTVEIGEFATFAGWGSQVLTHSIDLRQNRQSASPVRVGAYCFVGTRAVILKGTSLPAKSILAAGSVLTSTPLEELRIYSGVPATPHRTVNTDYAYFGREEGKVE
jgi:acetyltransferase-like isoleucine patch superfamily enzyme